LQGRGESPTLQEVLQQQTDRDQRDASRQVGRLEPAQDAIEFVTDGMTADEVLDQLLKIIREKALNRQDG
jgi:pantoate ligase/cytidylate kinase